MYGFCIVCSVSFLSDPESSTHTSSSPRSSERNQRTEGENALAKGSISIATSSSKMRTAAATAGCARSFLFALLAVSHWACCRGAVKSALLVVDMQVCAQGAAATSCSTHAHAAQSVPLAALRSRGVCVWPVRCAARGSCRVLLCYRAASCLVGQWQCRGMCGLCSMPSTGCDSMAALTGWVRLCAQLPGQEIADKVLGLMRASDVRCITCCCRLSSHKIGTLRTTSPLLPPTASSRRTACSWRTPVWATDGWAGAAPGCAT